MTEQTKPLQKAVVTPFSSTGAGSIATGGNHKNNAIGPVTNKLLPEWRRTRDYEQFMPTPEK